MIESRHAWLVYLRRLHAITLVCLLAACGSPTLAPEPAALIAATNVQTVPAEVLNLDVRQDTIQQTICVAGYTASVRPSTSYTNGVKLKLMREQAPSDASPKDFELDHRIPLALGGHPRSLKNLMLQRWEGKDGAKAKDRLEVRLQKLVCSGKLLLDDARNAIFVDWQGAYRTFVQQR